MVSAHPPGESNPGCRWESSSAVWLPSSRASLSHLLLPKCERHLWGYSSKSLGRDGPASGSFKQEEPKLQLRGRSMFPSSWFITCLKCFGCLVWAFAALPPVPAGCGCDCHSFPSLAFVGETWEFCTRRSWSRVCHGVTQSQRWQRSCCGHCCVRRSRRPGCFPRSWQMHHSEDGAK